MEHNFWHSKWEKLEIGFHQQDINPFLKQYIDDLELARGATVFVPLCGKTLDMTWLLDKGFCVIGAELSELAVQQYFQSLSVEPVITTMGKLKKYSAPDLSIYCGDFFDLTSEIVGKVDAVYDRAALVALPDNMRLQYSQQVATVSNNAKTLLITYEYDQSVHAGPPFSVLPCEVEQLFSPNYSIVSLYDEQFAGGLKGKVPARERVWLLG